MKTTQLIRRCKIHILPVLSPKHNLNNELEGTAKLWTLHLPNELPFLSVAVSLGDLNTTRLTSLSLSEEVLLEISIE